jgi:hypothetical protein
MERDLQRGHFVKQSAVRGGLLHRSFALQNSTRPRSRRRIVLPSAGRRTALSTMLFRIARINIYFDGGVEPAKEFLWQTK